MKPIKSSFPPGTVGLPTGLQPRYWEFIESMDALEVPEGTVFRRESGCDITHNCNRCIQGMEGDWIWFMDDDQAFESDVLMRLLAHAYGPSGKAVDLVMPLNVVKMAPHTPMIFHNISQRGVPYQWGELFGTGLFALPAGDMVGRAGMLIKKRVLDAIGFPWVKAGQIFAGVLTEDTFFALEVQERGYQIWIDQDLTLEHICHFAVRAKRDETGRYQPEIVSTGYQYE